jgi:hypothetical protein
LHRLLLELLPGGAKKFLSAAQARALLASVRLCDVVGRTRRRLAADLVTELDRIDKRIKTADTELGELVASTGSLLAGADQQHHGDQQFGFAEPIAVLVVHLGQSGEQVVAGVVTFALDQPEQVRRGDGAGHRERLLIERVGQLGNGGAEGSRDHDRRRNEDPDSIGRRQLPDGWRAGEGRCLPV